MNHNVPLNDSRVAVLAALKQLGTSGSEAIDHQGKALSAFGTFVLSLLSVCCLTLGALFLKADQVAHNSSFGVRKEQEAA